MVRTVVCTCCDCTVSASVHLLVLAIAVNDSDVRPLTLGTQLSLGIGFELFPMELKTRKLKIVIYSTIQINENCHKHDQINCNT